MLLTRTETLNVSIKDQLILLAASLNVLKLWKEYSKCFEDSKYISTLTKNKLAIEYDESIHGSPYYVKCNEYKITEIQYKHLTWLNDVRSYLVNNEANDAVLKTINFGGAEIKIEENNKEV